LLFLCIFSCFLLVGYRLPGFIWFDPVVETLRFSFFSNGYFPIFGSIDISHNNHFMVVVAFTG